MLCGGMFTSAALMFDHNRKALVQELTTISQATMGWCLYSELACMTGDERWTWKAIHMDPWQLCKWHEVLEVKRTLLVGNGTCE